jgi:hypothetical protein
VRPCLLPGLWIAFKKLVKFGLRFSTCYP